MSLKTRNNIIGNNVAALRRFRNLSQASLGASIGRDRHYVKRIESGATLDASNLEAIAKVLQVKDPFIITRSAIDVDSISQTINKPLQRNLSRGNLSQNHLRSKR